MAGAVDGSIQNVKQQTGRKTSQICSGKSSHNPFQCRGFNARLLPPGAVHDSGKRDPASVLLYVASRWVDLNLRYEPLLMVVLLSPPCLILTLPKEGAAG